ncbi:MAG: ATP-binding protein [Gammaproteobacteria bacterium]|nr:ATP-binding protein [Gammaproteobacteria bacterium]
MFLKSHYFWRTYLGYVVVALIGTTLFAASLIKKTEQQVQESLDTSLSVSAELLKIAISPALRNLNYQLIRETSETIAGLSQLRITIIDNNGLILADSHENPFVMDNHFRRPEVQLAVINGIGRAQRYSFTLQEDFQYLAIPMYSQSQLLGFARVAKSSSSLAADISQAQFLLLRNSAFATFFILLLAFYLAARQASKVAELTAVTEEISRGNFTHRIPEGNNVGLKKMSEAINQMARSSAQSVTENTADSNRLSTIFTCMVEGVIDIGMDQNILHINEAAARMLSINEKSCIGKPLWKETRNQEIINALDEAIKTHSVINTQVQLSKDKIQQTVELYVASLSDEDDKPIGAVLVLHDITELKNLERVRTDFVANASHELKTPITAIRGLTETILGDEEVDDETVTRFIGRVHSQSLRLSQLVGDLMAISRLENSQGNEDFSKINFTDLIRQTVQEVQSTADENEHKLVTELTDEGLEVYGDRQNLRQLVDNLIDNAMKYTTDSGTITVKLLKDEQTAELQVSDTGIGISPKYQSRVFERFYRVDKARSQSLGGTGLGLSIVKNIADKHSGSVSVKSKLGSGSTFIFRIPLEKPVGVKSD